MKLPNACKALLLAAIGCGTVPASAQASGIELVAGQLAGALQIMVVSQNLCVHFTYDENGNRITLASSGLTSATPPIWGATTYPCFIWGN